MSPASRPAPHSSANDLGPIGLWSELDVRGSDPNAPSAVSLSEGVDLEVMRCNQT